MQLNASLILVKCAAKLQEQLRQCQSPQSSTAPLLSGGTWQLSPEQLLQALVGQSAQYMRHYYSVAHVTFCVQTPDTPDL